MQPRQPGQSKISDFYNPLFEAIAALAIMTNFALTIFYFPRLPLQKPVHYGLDGEPDMFKQTSLLQFMVPGLVSLVLYIILTAAQASVARAKEPLRTKVPLTVEQQLKVKAVVIRGLFFLKIVVPGLFLYLNYLTLQGTAGMVVRVDAPFFVLSALAIGAILYMLFGLLSAQRAPPKPASSPHEQRPGPQSDLRS